MLSAWNIGQGLEFVPKIGVEIVVGWVDGKGRSIDFQSDTTLNRLLYLLLYLICERSIQTWNTRLKANRSHYFNITKVSERLVVNSGLPYKDSVKGLGHCKLQALKVYFTKHVSTAPEKKTASNKTVFFFSEIALCFGEELNGPKGWNVFFRSVMNCRVISYVTSSGLLITAGFLLPLVTVATGWRRLESISKRND